MYKAGQNMTIQSALERSADLSNWIDSLIHGVEIPSSDREVMAAALFDQVHEHHKAIERCRALRCWLQAMNLDRSREVGWLLSKTHLE